jgi:hypothetical protein
MFTASAKKSPFEEPDTGANAGLMSPSWMPASMQTPPRAMSPPATGHGEGGTAGGTGPQRSATTGSRNEKHRLSLTFLRRASVSEGHNARGTNGSIDARVAPTNATSGVGGAVAPHHAQLANSPEVDGEERPGTRESMGENSIRSRVGSMKKRLSLRGMGGHGSTTKKGKGQGVVGVVEESGEE